MKRMYSAILSNYRLLWITCIIGFIVHGQMIFNKITWWDDIVTLSGWIWKNGIVAGRWFYSIISLPMEILAGADSLPIMNSVVSFVCIGILLIIFFELYQIKSKFQINAMLILWVADLAVTGNLGYGTSMGINYIGLLIGGMAGWIVIDGYLRNDKKNYVLSIIFLVCAIAEYQCYLAFVVSEVLLYMIYEYVQLDKQKTWKEFLTEGLYYLSMFIISILLYVISTKLIIYLSGQELRTGSVDIKSFGIVSAEEYLKRIIRAYNEFFSPQIHTKSYSFFPFHWSGWWYITLFVFILLSLITIVRMIKKKQIVKMLQYLILLGLFPLALNLIFVLYGGDGVRIIHTYANMFLFMYLLITANALNNIKKENLAQKFFTYVVPGLCLVIGCLYIKYDNLCYAEMQFTQQRAISYANRLVMRVEELEGYEEGTPIIILNYDSLKEKALPLGVFSDKVITDPYCDSMLGYGFENYIKLYVNNEINIQTSENFQVDDEIEKKLSHYPDKDSIQLIDGIVYVKY